MESGQEPRQRMVNDKLTVSEVATTALVALPPIILIRQLVEVLRSCRHAAFPVTPDTKTAYQSGNRDSSSHCLALQTRRFLVAHDMTCAQSCVNL